MIGPDNQPVTNEPVYLFFGENLTLTTDNKGMASFSLDTTLWKDGVHLKVGYCLLVSRRIDLVQGLPIGNQFSIYQLFNQCLIKETFHHIDRVGGEQHRPKYLLNKSILVNLFVCS